MKRRLEVSRKYLVLKLIDLLNQGLSREYQAIIRLRCYSQVLKGAEFMNIAGELEKRATEELSHALIKPSKFTILAACRGRAKTVRTLDLFR
jgi:bacterioferritin (cytochrome b1)